MMVFGWYEGLEGNEKRAGRKRKTLLHWKLMLRETGIDWTDVEPLGGDRDGWKRSMTDRMNHFD